MVAAFPRGGNLLVSPLWLPLPVYVPYAQLPDLQRRKRAQIASPLLGLVQVARGARRKVCPPASIISALPLSRLTSSLSLSLNSQQRQRTRASQPPLACPWLLVEAPMDCRKPPSAFSSS
jgi:hypothetical protein